MNQARLRNLELHHPSLAENADRIIERDGELIVKRKDGTSVLFDEATTETRTLPLDSSAMTDEEAVREFKFRLRRIMQRKGITQTELSSETGIPQYLISNYINGKTSPSFRNVDKIARALGCSTDDLRYID